MTLVVQVPVEEYQRAKDAEVALRELLDAIYEGKGPLGISLVEGSRVVAAIHAGDAALGIKRGD